MSNFKGYVNLWQDLGMSQMNHHRKEAESSQWQPGYLAERKGTPPSFL